MRATNNTSRLAPAESVSPPQHAFDELVTSDDARVNGPASPPSIPLGGWRVAHESVGGEHAPGSREQIRDKSVE
jgi:hypothetical protein